MAYDDLKEFNGRRYSGMPVGGEHSWNYTNAVWRERKAAPDDWEFTFTSVKRRERSAPDGSGAPPDTRYHWYILANQFVRKIDKDSYSTFMSGLKYKIAHKRPQWRKWSCEYPLQISARARTVEILEGILDRLKGQACSDDVSPSGARGWITSPRSTPSCRESD